MEAPGGGGGQRSRSLPSPESPSGRRFGRRGDGVRQASTCIASWVRTLTVAAAAASGVEGTGRRAPSGRQARARIEHKTIQVSLEPNAPEKVCRASRGRAAGRRPAPLRTRSAPGTSKQSRRPQRANQANHCSDNKHRQRRQKEQAAAPARSSCLCPSPPWVALGGDGQGYRPSAALARSSVGKEPKAAMGKDTAQCVMKEDTELEKR